MLGRNDNINSPRREDAACITYIALNQGALWMPIWNAGVKTVLFATMHKGHKIRVRRKAVKELDIWAPDKRLTICGEKYVH